MDPFFAGQETHPCSVKILGQTLQMCKHQWLSLTVHALVEQAMQPCGVLKKIHLDKVAF